MQPTSTTDLLMCASQHALRIATPSAAHASSSNTAAVSQLTVVPVIEQAAATDAEISAPDVTQQLDTDMAENNSGWYNWHNYIECNICPDDHETADDTPLQLCTNGGGNRAVHEFQTTAKPNLQKTNPGMGAG